MFNGNELEIGRALRIANLHSKVFPKFKNMYYGRKIAVVGSGPSLNKYIPMKDVVHIGVNNAFKSHVELDFLFMADYARVKNFIAEASSYLPERCVKFYGLYDEDYNYNLYEHKLHIPEALACQANALRYYLNRVDLYPNEKFTGNIETKPLPVFGSVTFNAISFALYTNPKALYLVGLDTDSRGYYDGSKQDIILTTMNDAIKNLRDGYRKLKDYALIHYPKTDIISINPVGLKGLFRDMYINNSGEHIYKDCDISENEWLTIPVAANRFANLESSAPWTKDQFELLAGLIADRLRLGGGPPPPPFSVRSDERRASVIQLHIIYIVCFLILLSGRLSANSEPNLLTLSIIRVLFAESPKPKTKLRAYWLFAYLPRNFSGIA